MEEGEKKAKKKSTWAGIWPVKMTHESQGQEELWGGMLL